MITVIISYQQGEFKSLSQCAGFEMTSELGNTAGYILDHITQVYDNQNITSSIALYTMGIIFFEPTGICKKVASWSR